MKTSAFAFLIMGVLTILASGFVDCRDISFVPPLMPINTAQEVERVQIQISDLPGSVKESLKGPDYAGWTVDAAYKTLVTNPESPELEGILVYIVKLKRQEETTLIRFDKDGKRLKDKEIINK